ncbi:DUF6520 family protein [Flavobacterium eburneipallidum]|uniref:DUF6520 family protein n=1 Tax=Flavobacterium eburneipallidum TaxID=3003263 RepID=UPI0022AC851A|nr:DUF6520 family protein [Flavobacterium eburneipallidum]
MKTSIVKMILPMGVFALAVTGAFASHTVNVAKKAAPAPIQGWVQVAGACNQSVQCSNTGNILCKTNANQQVFGKDEAGDCAVELYRASN